VLLITRESLDLPVLLRADGLLQLMEDLAFDTRRGRLVVPRGFVTDLASVPFFLRGLVPNAGRRVNLAAILHDWCCEHLKARLKAGLTLDDTDPDGPVFGPVAADALFRETLRDLGMPPLMSSVMWEGVRWGALGSDYRRPGWTSQLAPLVVLTVLTAWLTVPAGIFALVFLCFYLIAEAVVDSMVSLVSTRRRHAPGPGPGTDPGTDSGGAAPVDPAH
jgi:hypothetical protein